MRAEVIVVGGGVMGCLCALRLAEAGLRCVVLEKSVPGAEASSAAAGILAPSVEAWKEERALVMGRKSALLHAELAQRLESDFGLGIGWSRCGVMKVAWSESENRELEEQAAMLKREGIKAELLSGEEARSKEAALSDRVECALDLPEEAQLEPRLLLRALALAGEQRGVHFRSGSMVREIFVEGDRFIGVNLDGERLAADRVVVAAGSWTTLIPGLGLREDAVFPVRGQMLTSDSRPPLFQRIIYGPNGYIVTRVDGRMLLGSTEEHVGFRRGVTMGGLAKILSMASEITPKVQDLSVSDMWSSFRPGTPDGLPLVGELDVKGLYVVSGHYRNGILLAPLSAELITQEITSAESHAYATSLSPKRFMEQR